jgi:hypothetical protein
LYQTQNKSPLQDPWVNKNGVKWLIWP